MGWFLIPFVVVIVLRVSESSTFQNVIGLQDLTRNIWSPGSTGEPGSSALDAIDALLVVLNSKKLHKRQAPSTCPYCPYGYPCASGCPTVPNPNCRLNTCSLGSPGTPGPPGPPGAPGFPFYVRHPSNPYSGPPGPPGICYPGPPGSPGIPGRDGTCPTAGGTIRVDANIVKGFIDKFRCPLVGRCRYSINDLIHRLNQVIAKLHSLETYKSQITAFGSTLAIYRDRYSASKVPGIAGPPGAPGVSGIKGFPGYEGAEGKCVMRLDGHNLPHGLPGVPGPKGEPGPHGDKICNCRGDLGPLGVVGPSLVGDLGPKGYKGNKGQPGMGGYSGLAYNI